MKQNQSTIFHRAAMMLAAVMLTVTAWAQTYTVTLKPGDGSGSDITYNSTDDYYGTSLNGGDVPEGKFFRMNSQLWFKLPNCPGSFSAPSGKVFTGWSTNGGEDTDYSPGIWPISSNMTLTACWDTFGDAKLQSITPSVGTLTPAFSPDEDEYNIYIIYTGSPVEVTVTAVPRDPNATVDYNDEGDCPPTLHAGESVDIEVTNGTNKETYEVSVHFVYSITMTTEGEGTAKVYDFYDSSVETYIGEPDRTYQLRATPAAGWRFKEWQLVSGGGQLEYSTSQNGGYYRFPDADANNVVFKAVFEPYTVTLKAGEDGLGSDITYNRADDYYGTSLNGGDVPKGEFYTMNSQLWFRAPDCPGSFSALGGMVFAGWSTNGGQDNNLSPGSHYPISGDVTLTACWDTAGDAKLLTITPSAGTLDRNFSPDDGDHSYTLYVIYTGSPVEATVTAVPRDPNATVKYEETYNSCPTLHDGENVLIQVTNGTNWEAYQVVVRTVYSITMTTEGYGTYYNGTHDTTLPSGMKAYIVTAKTSGGETGTLTYEEIADGDGDGTTVKKTVPSGVAVMLKADASGNPWNLALSATDIDDRTFATNLLHGSNVAVETTGGDVYYKLSYNTSGTNLGWYYGVAGGGAFESGAYKAWLAVPESAGARGFVSLPGDDEGVVTGIVDIEHGTWNSDHSAGTWYSLDGRRLNGKPTAKGLYIHNGKKVVIK